LDTVAPDTTATSDLHHFIPISQLSRVPPYIPKVGRGIAINKARPTSPYFLIRRVSPFSLTLSMNRLKKVHLLDTLEENKFSRSQTTKNTAIELAVTIANINTGCILIKPVITKHSFVRHYYLKQSDHFPFDH
jgi:hypothetical protein